MRKRFLFNFLLLFSALLFGLLICEIIARIITRVDENGQVYLRNQLLLPYRFPSETVRYRMNKYFKNADKAYIIHDPLLGWTIAPNGKGSKGLYQANSRGIRSQPREYPFRPPPGILRIAIFGDSFTHGDEEPYYKTWGKFLEDYLNEAEVATEVLNFGVPGYGIGQAYLRWKYLGQKFSPQIVVFGFQAENMKRTVNIFRQMYSRRTGLVFTKPRFILNQERELELVNSPVIPPRQVADVMENLSRSPLARYEYWYNPKNYSAAPWFKSRFISLLYGSFTEAHLDHRNGPGIWDREGEATRLTLAILQEFAREVKEAESIPIILHIPKKPDLKHLDKGEIPAHYYIFRELKKDGILVVDPAEEMKGKHRLYKHSHFSSKGGRIVARVLADAIYNISKEKIY